MDALHEHLKKAGGVIGGDLPHGIGVRGLGVDHLRGRLHGGDVDMGRIHDRVRQALERHDVDGGKVRQILRTLGEEEKGSAGGCAAEGKDDPGLSTRVREVHL